MKGTDIIEQLDRVIKLPPTAYRAEIVLARNEIVRLRDALAKIEESTWLTWREAGQPDCDTKCLIKCRMLATRALLE